MTYIVQQYFHANKKVGDLHFINDLLRQLSRSGSKDAIDYSDLKEFLNESLVWVARKGGNIVAMGSLTPNRGLGRSRSFGYVQNIITDEKHRGKIEHVTVWRKDPEIKVEKDQSLAEIIVKEMIVFAKERPYRYLELTSGPDRIAANKLYRKLGFRLVAEAPATETDDTNLYKLLL